MEHQFQLNSSITRHFVHLNGCTWSPLHCHNYMYLLLMNPQAFWWSTSLGILSKTFSSSTNIRYPDPDVTKCINLNFCLPRHTTTKSPASVRPPCFAWWLCTTRWARTRCGRSSKTWQAPSWNSWICISNVQRHRILEPLPPSQSLQCNIEKGELGGCDTVKWMCRSLVVVWPHEVWASENDYTETSHVYVGAHEQRSRKYSNKIVIR